MKSADFNKLLSSGLGGAVRSLAGQFTALAYRMRSGINAMACGTERRSRSLSEHPFALMIVAVIACAGSCTKSDARPAGNKADWSSKVAAELITLYDDYSNYLASGKPGVFKSTSPLVQIIDDRVMIDAVASGDADVLKADLEALGMQHGVAFSRVVSGQLPIMAIRQLAKLPSLNFARAVSTVLQRNPRQPSFPDIRS